MRASAGALEHLRSDAGKQAEVLRAACPRDIPSDPVAQLDVSKSAAEAVLAAVNTVALLSKCFTQHSQTNRRRALLLCACAPTASIMMLGRCVDRVAVFSDCGASAKSGLCQRWERAFLDLPTQRIGREIRLIDAQREAYQKP
jgi:hypothetical protein